MKLNSNLRVFVAFFRRCLIYNVLIPFCPAPLLSSRPQLRCLLILPHSIGFVKNFFQELFRLPSAFPFSFLCQPVQLVYSIRFLPACQALFSFFFQKTFSRFPSGFSPPEPRRPSPDSSFIISPLPPFVNTLFPILHIISACAPPWLYLLIYNTNFARFSPNLLRFSHYISTYNICF